MKVDDSHLAINHPVVLEFEHAGESCAVRGSVVRLLSRHVWVQCLSPSSAVMRLPPRTRLDVRFWDETQLYCFASHVIEIVPGTTPTVRLERPAEIRSLQRRNFFRVTARIPFTFRKEGNQDPPHPAQTRDISGGGLCFATAAESLAPGEVIELTIRVNAQRNVSTLARVVRSSPRRHDVVYGVEYKGIDKASQDAIVGLVYEIQRRQRL